QRRANKALALREQQQQQEMALGQMRLADAQRQRDADARIGAAYDSARGPDGSVDYDKFQAAIPGADMRYAQPLLAAGEQSDTRRQTLMDKRGAAFKNVVAAMVQAGDFAPDSVSELVTLGQQNGVL